MYTWPPILLVWIQLPCFFLKKMGHSQSLLSFIFGLFKQTFQFFTTIFVKNVHPVSGTWIRTHDLWKMGLLP